MNRYFFQLLVLIFLVNFYVACSKKGGSGGSTTPAKVYTVTTIAGNGTAGFLDGAADAAEFNLPVDVAVSASGTVFIADQLNYRVRALSTSGVVSTLAGNGMSGNVVGPGSNAEFGYPMDGLAVDAAGNIYLAVGGTGAATTDAANNRILKISAAGVVSNLAGNGTTGLLNGAGTSAEFYSPSGAVVDQAGNIYVTDFFNNVIREITPAGVVSTFAGNGKAGYADGAAASAEFAFSGDSSKGHAAIAIDPSGNLYVCDDGNSSIRKITPAGVVSTVAGNGTAGYLDGPTASAEFNIPAGIAIDNAGNIYVSDKANSCIREISAGMVTTVAGNPTAGYADGTGTNAAFDSPNGLAINASGNLYLADTRNECIRKITIQ